MKTKTLLVLLFFCATLSAQVQIFHSTQSEQHSSGSAPCAYLVGDSVALRNDSSISGAVITTLPIGSRLLLLDKTDAVSTFRGIESSWYKVKTGTRTGWVWGGFITEYAYGSNKDPEVKFLYAFSHVTEKQTNDGYGHTYTQRNTYMQIRAMKNGRQLDKVVFEMNATYFQPYLFGSKGVSGVDDVLAVGEPCEGGCGCSGWDHYIFWDGAKLHYVVAIGGVADGDFSEGNSIVFPSDMDGEKDYLQIGSDYIDTAFDYNNDGNVMRRVITNTYYVWNGTKLVKAPGKKVARNVYYYNYEEHREIEKPEPVEEE